MSKTDCVPAFWKLPICLGERRKAISIWCGKYRYIYEEHNLDFGARGFLNLKDIQELANKEEWMQGRTVFQVEFRVPSQVRRAQTYIWVGDEKEKLFSYSQGLRSWHACTSPSKVISGISAKLKVNPRKIKTGNTKNWWTKKLIKSPI